MIWAYTDLGMKMVVVDLRCRSLTNWSLVADTPMSDSHVKEGRKRKVGAITNEVDVASLAPLVTVKLSRDPWA